jgi:hypothetical protein
MSAGTADLITQECSPAFSGGLKVPFKLNGAAVSVISTPDEVRNGNSLPGPQCDLDLN